MKLFAIIAASLILMPLANASKPQPVTETRPAYNMYKEFCPGCADPNINGCGIFNGNTLHQ